MTEKPIGTINFSMWTGLEIYAIDYNINDKVKFKEFHCTDDSINRSKMITAKIRFNKHNNPYFINRQQRVYFNEIMTE